MIENISIIGGDLRLLSLAEMLVNDGFNINTFYLENCKDLDGKIVLEKELENLSNIVIGPIPFSKDDIYLNTPFSDEKVKIINLLDSLSNKTLIAGAIKNNVIERARKYNIKIIDIMKREELAILNAILTAEGAIQIISENTSKTIYDSNILILGFGRIGKILAYKLKAFGANVNCEARKLSDLAWIKAYSYKPVYLEALKENLKNTRYDIIINTVPFMILDKEMLENINKNVLILDLASKPGGVDILEASNLNLKVIWALGLPGKIAPDTSAKYIKETLYNIFKEKI